MSPFESLDDWPVDTVAAAVIDAGGVQRHGPTDRAFPLASITKLLTALAALVAHEEGTLSLDEPVIGEATTADLLAHCAGIAPDTNDRIAAPRTRRIYSTSGYDLLAGHVAVRAGMTFEDYLAEAVIHPLGMEATRLTGSAGADASGSVDDLVRLVDAWTVPRLVDGTTLARATRPHEPDLAGVLPGYGRQDPNPWGLGPEIRGEKAPHWTSPENSPVTFGHFGRSGTMLWIDPVASVAAIALADRDFGDWAVRAWPEFSTAALRS